jgi:hypothetical protein
VSPLRILNTSTAWIAADCHASQKRPGRKVVLALSAARMFALRSCACLTPFSRPRDMASNLTLLLKRSFPSHPSTRMLTVVGAWHWTPRLCRNRSETLRPVHDSRLRKAGSGERLRNALLLESGSINRPRYGTQRVTPMYCAGLTYFFRLLSCRRGFLHLHVEFFIGKSAEGSRDDRPESSYCYLL